MASITAGIDDTKLFAQTPSLRPGSYRLKVEKIEMGETPVQKTPFFRATLGVVTAQGEGANPVGTSASFFVQKGKFDYHLKAIARFVSALLNESAQVTGAMCEELAGKDQPGAGSEVFADVRQKMKDGVAMRFESGEPIVEITWTAVPEAVVATPTTAKPAVRKTA